MSGNFTRARVELKRSERSCVSDDVVCSFFRHTVAATLAFCLSADSLCQVENPEDKFSDVVQVSRLNTIPTKLTTLSSLLVGGGDIDNVGGKGRGLSGQHVIVVSGSSVSECLDIIKRGMCEAVIHERKEPVSIEEAPLWFSLLIWLQPSFDSIKDMTIPLDMMLKDLLKEIKLGNLDVVDSWLRLFTNSHVSVNLSMSLALLRFTFKSRDELPSWIGLRDSLKKVLIDAEMDFEKIMRGVL